MAKSASVSCSETPTLTKKKVRIDFVVFDDDGWRTI